MTPLQIKNIVNSLQNRSRKELIIRIDTNNFRKGLEKSRELLQKMEREMRIQKLELAVKRMNISRSWM
jgi:hypothetical protein